MAKKKKKNKRLKRRGTKKNMSIKFVLYTGILLIFLVLFLPTTFLLAVGMLPTFVAAVLDNVPGKNKTFTIGAMNLAGCFPYLLGVWMNSHSMDTSIAYLLDPTTIIVMYGAAAFGYLIDLFVTRLVASLLVEASKSRLKKIKEEQKALEERWGHAVNGKLQLDVHGFPIKKEEGKDEEIENAVG